MSKLSFVKYQGAGNDFILIDSRTLHFQYSVSQLCHRKTGIGADGLILLQNDPTADFRMRIFNNDGTEAESCGNGLRCLLQFILHLGLPRKPYRIATHDRIVQAHFVDDRVAIHMGPPTHVKQLTIQDLTYHFLNTGVPHLVTFVPNVHQIDLPTQGSTLRYHPHFQPTGTNVNFATLQSNNTISVRTYERGLEAETLACGTGACAVGYIAAKYFQLPNPIRIQYPGGNLEIAIEGEEIIQIGEALKVFEGVTLQLDFRNRLLSSL